MLLHTKLNNSQMYFILNTMTYKTSAYHSGHVLQGSNVNYTKIHVWVRIPWSASSVLAKKI